VSESNTSQSGHSEPRSERRHRAGAFDIRNFIAALLGIYGIVLVIDGLFATSDADIAKAQGVNVNLWTGIALVIAAGLFAGWARLRPVIVPAKHDDS
jgi:hypothetical protein